MHNEGDFLSEVDNYALSDAVIYKGKRKKHPAGFKVIMIIISRRLFLPVHLGVKVN